MDMNGDAVQAGSDDPMLLQPGATNYIVSVSQSKRYLFAYQVIHSNGVSQAAGTTSTEQMMATSAEVGEQDGPLSQ